MNTTTETAHNEPSLFENVYDKEMFVDILKYESRKTRNTLLIIGGVLLVSDLLALAMANLLSTMTLAMILIVPIIYVGLGFLAGIKPILGMSLGAALFVFIIGYNIYAFGATTIISGLIVKAVLVFFFIKGFNHAKEAKKASEDLAALR